MLGDRCSMLRSTRAGEARKVFQYCCDEITMTGVLRRQSRGIKVQDIARFGGRIRPRSGGHRQQLAFEVRLPLAKLSCIALDLRQRAGGRSLSERPCHGACRDRAVRQSSGALESIRCASDRSTEPIDISSTARPVSAGILILVATRRNAANESPSIISSSVMTS